MRAASARDSISLALLPGSTYSRRYLTVEVWSGFTVALKSHNGLTTAMYRIASWLRFELYQLENIRRTRHHNAITQTALSSAICSATNVDHAARPPSERKPIVCCGVCHSNFICIFSCRRFAR